MPDGDRRRRSFRRGGSLGGGMLAAGYRSLIATMWSIRDVYSCQDVVLKFTCLVYNLANYLLHTDYMPRYQQNLKTVFWPMQLHHHCG